MWMKSSPRQQKIADCRKIARTLAVNVNLRRRPDALESEKRLDTIFYWVTWQYNKQPEPWVLHTSRRGWQSPFEGWRWVSGEANASWHEIIRSTLGLLPEGVSAIMVTQEGLGVAWDERGEPEVVKNIAQCLGELREKGEEIYS